MPRWQRQRSAQRDRASEDRACVICGGSAGLHLWRCLDCAFTLCQICMQENSWGLTCNNITWECPDCGRTNSY